MRNLSQKILIFKKDPDWIFCNKFLFSIHSRMSKSTKRKHVAHELMTAEYKLPTEPERIVRVLGGRGNNLHEVFDPKEKETSSYLVKLNKLQFL